jgi:hypothetical protein
MDVPSASHQALVALARILARQIAIEALQDESEAAPSRRNPEKT